MLSHFVCFPFLFRCCLFHLFIYFVTHRVVSRTVKYSSTKENLSGHLTLRVIRESSGEQRELFNWL